MASIASGYVGKLDPGNGTQYSIGSTAYGECNTAEDVAAKVVDLTGFTLITGATIHVKFENSNSVLHPTLNVNDTGAYRIKRNGSFEAGKTDRTSWKAGSVVSFTFDGIYWMMNDFMDEPSPQNLGFWFGHCYTAAETTAKTVACLGFSVHDGGIVSIKFHNAVPASATLNINNTGALPMRRQNSAIEANVINAGDIATFVYGSDGNALGYHLISVNSETSLPAAVSALTSNLEQTIIQVETASFSSLPITITDSAIGADHVVLKETLSNPAAQTSDWTVTTAVGSLTISGNISGSTSVSLILGIPWNAVSADLF